MLQSNLRSYINKFEVSICEKNFVLLTGLINLSETYDLLKSEEEKNIFIDLVKKLFYKITQIDVKNILEVDEVFNLFSNIHFDGLLQLPIFKKIINFYLCSKVEKVKKIKNKKIKLTEYEVCVLSDVNFPRILKFFKFLSEGNFKELPHKILDYIILNHKGTNSEIDFYFRGILNASEYEFSKLYDFNMNWLNLENVENFNSEFLSHFLFSRFCWIYIVVQFYRGTKILEFKKLRKKYENKKKNPNLLNLYEKFEENEKKIKKKSENHKLQINCKKFYLLQVDLEEVLIQPLTLKINSLQKIILKKYNVEDIESILLKLKIDKEGSFLQKLMETGVIEVLIKFSSSTIDIVRIRSLKCLNIYYELIDSLVKIRKYFHFCSKANQNYTTENLIIMKNYLNQEFEPNFNLSNQLLINTNALPNINKYYNFFKFIKSKFNQTYINDNYISIFISEYCCLYINYLLKTKNFKELLLRSCEAVNLISQENSFFNIFKCSLHNSLNNVQIFIEIAIKMCEMAVINKNSENSTLKLAVQQIEFELFNCKTNLISFLTTSSLFYSIKNQNIQKETTKILQILIKNSIYKEILIVKFNLITLIKEWLRQILIINKIVQHKIGSFKFLPNIEEKIKKNEKFISIYTTEENYKSYLENLNEILNLYNLCNEDKQVEIYVNSLMIVNKYIKEYKVQEYLYLQKLILNIETLFNNKQKNKTLFSDDPLG